MTEEAPASEYWRSVARICGFGLAALFGGLGLYMVLVVIALSGSHWLGHVLFTLPFCVGLAVGWYGWKFPVSSVLLVGLGALLFITSLIGLVGVFLWGPPGLVLFGAGLVKAYRMRVQPAWRRISTRIE